MSNKDFMKEMENWSPQYLSKDKIMMNEYLSLILEDKNKNLSDLAHARLYHMIESHGIEWYEDENGNNRPKYKFFENEIYGLDDTIEKLVGLLHGGARLLPVRKRIIMLMGPVGGGKSTIASMLKKGLENYSLTEEGKIYSIVDCPIHENPLNALPENFREILKTKHNIFVEGRLCPYCQFKLDNELKGDFRKFELERISFSEQKRIGIGTFLPNDVKCVSLDSIIPTSKGLMKLKELQPKELKNDEFYPIDNEIVNMYGEKEKASHYYNNGEQKTLKIRTKLGFEIECTENHPLRVLNNCKSEWRKSKDIKIGDKLQIQYGMNLFGDSNIINEQQARFIGYFVSEGYLYYPKYKIEISTTSNYIYEDIKNIIFDNWGYSPNYYGQKKVVISNKEISEWLSYNVLDGGITICSQDKDVPLCIRTAPKNIQLEFLKGLYAGDGCFRLRSDRDSLQVIYETASKNLARQVHMMLLNMGYVASIREYTHNYNNSQQFFIVLNGDQALEFSKEIKMFEEKYCSLNNDQELTHKSQFKLVDGIRDFINTLIWDLPSKIRSKYIRYGNTYQEQNQRTFNLKSCKEFLETVSENIDINIDDISEAYNAVNDACNNHCIWLEVVDIQKNGIQYVADITVPKTHSFIANGIVSHNSQDISELIGSINLSKLADIGVESDPRAFTFDGELNIANRGIMEMVEILKADEKFLYIFLTLAQENVIKAPKFPFIYADMVILSHTNETEWDKFMKKPENEALKDRIITVLCPYVLEIDNEKKIYEKEWLNSNDSREISIAPRTFDLCASFAILSRLEESPDKKVDLVKKMKAYNGEEIEGIRRQDVNEMKRNAEREGMFGIGPRAIMNSISEAATKSKEEYINLSLDEKRKMCYGIDNIEDYKPSVDAIDMMRTLSETIDNDPETDNKEKENLKKLLEMAREELDKKLKEDIQKAFCFEFENEAEILFDNYLNNVIAYINKERIKDPITGRDIDPDETLMRSIESMILVNEGSRDQHRQTVVNRFSRAKQKGKEFDFKTHNDLKEAITKKIFEDRKDTIQITTTALHPDKEKLSELNRVIKRLVEQGYTPYSAAKMIRYVGKLLNR